MSIDIDDLPAIEYIPTPLSIRADQRDWLDEMAAIEMRTERLARPNRSRIVQEALDLLRDVRTGRAVVMRPVSANGE